MASGAASHDGFASNDARITEELCAIYTNIQKVLDLRHKYVRVSLQGSNDNPKDDPAWEIYPPPPNPVWYPEPEKSDAPPSASGIASMQNSGILTRDSQRQSSDHQSHHGSSGGVASAKKRKHGENIGEDFEMDDLLPLPEAGEMEFRLDESGIFQVYENHKAREMDSPIVAIPTIKDFYVDLEQILDLSSDGPSKSFAFRRLQYLEGKWNLYILLNEYQEMADSKVCFFSNVSPDAACDA